MMLQYSRKGIMMLLRLERANDEVDRIERKIMMYQEQKKAALERRKKVEDEEIVRGIRMLKLDRKGLFKLLKGLEDGSVEFSDVVDAKGTISDKAESVVTASDGATVIGSANTESEVSSDV